MVTDKRSAEKTVRDIRRRTRKKYSAEEKIRIVVEGLRGEESIAELCRKEEPQCYVITNCEHISSYANLKQ